MAIIMDGKALAVKMQDQLQEKVARLKEIRNVLLKRLASIVRRSIFLRVLVRKS